MVRGYSVVFGRIAARPSALGWESAQELKEPLWERVFHSFERIPFYTMSFHVFFLLGKTIPIQLTSMFLEGVQTTKLDEVSVKEMRASQGIKFL